MSLPPVTDPAATERPGKSPLPTGIETICLSLVAIVLVVLSFFGLVSVAYPDPSRWQDDASAAAGLSEMWEFKAVGRVSP